MKTWLKHGIRLTVTGILLTWLAFQIDLRTVGDVLQQADPLWIIAGVLINVLGIVCAAWRWHVVLRAMGTVLSLVRVVRLVIIGAFFNMFLPSSVGGDVMKMVLVAPTMERRELAVASVLMDRVIGLAVTIGVGLGGGAVAAAGARGAGGSGDADTGGGGFLCRHDHAVQSRLARSGGALHAAHHLGSDRANRQAHPGLDAVDRPELIYPLPDCRDLGVAPDCDLPVGVLCRGWIWA
ncbi:MAG: flippase-like domain-containing protein [Oscillochloris sp.]|nr:flippase-like domain-containing protein [Oscillochloris sp.]